MKPYLYLLLFLPLAGTGQSFKERLTSRYFIAAAGAAAGVKDFTQYDNYNVGGFWGLENWKGKWKNGDYKQGEAFFLSSSLLVTFTGGTHLMNGVEQWCRSASYQFMPETRKQSFGKKLLNATIDWAVYSGMKSLTMWTANKLKNR